MIPRESAPPRTLTVAALERIVAEQRPALRVTSARITLAIARNPLGWETWFALQADVATAKAKRPSLWPVAEGAA